MKSRFSVDTCLNGMTSNYHRAVELQKKQVSAAKDRERVFIQSIARKIILQARKREYRQDMVRVRVLDKTKGEVHRRFLSRRDLCQARERERGHMTSLCSFVRSFVLPALRLALNNANRIESSPTQRIIS